MEFGGESFPSRSELEGFLVRVQMGEQFVRGREESRPFRCFGWTSEWTNRRSNEISQACRRSAMRSAISSGESVSIAMTLVRAVWPEVTRN